MQRKSVRLSNPERTEATRRSLIAAARELFVTRGYAETSTPEIVAAAGVTRGALYHHFADKQALFREVVEQEAAAVAGEIDEATAPGQAPRAALLQGSQAFLAAMAKPGRTRLLLLDGPAVLGRGEMDAIDRRHGNRTLREGLTYAMQQKAMPSLPVDALTAVLAAAFDRAALAITEGAPAEDFERVLTALVNGLMLRLR